jgi:hypothetical protein
MPRPEFVQRCASADLLILRAVPLWVWRPEYDLPRRRAFIDVDPGFTQISIVQGDKGIADGVARCERRFTVAQRIGKPGCTIPSEGGPWLPTLPPVYSSEWPASRGEAGRFSSVIRWQGFREAQLNGASYGQRDKEFLKIIELPKRTAQKFCVAMMGTKPETLTQHGWEVAPGEIISKTPASYRQFIQHSRAEFAVPKHGYVASRGGWFSDRSVCYLASGKPVLIADTGFDDWLAVGRGIVTYRDLDEAAAGVATINADYGGQCQAARQCAESVFATDRVLPRFLDTAMN